VSGQTGGVGDDPMRLPARLIVMFLRFFQSMPRLKNVVDNGP